MCHLERTPVLSRSQLPQQPNVKDACKILQRAARRVKRGNREGAPRSMGTSPVKAVASVTALWQTGWEVTSVHTLDS